MSMFTTNVELFKTLNIPEPGVEFGERPDEPLIKNPEDDKKRNLAALFEKKQSASNRNRKMIDIGEEYRVHKPVAPNLPMRALICGKSQIAGKTNLVGNICGRPCNDQDDVDFYAKDFKPENIHIVCKTAFEDNKWRNMIRLLKIPECNIMTQYDEMDLEILYNNLVESFNEKVKYGLRPEHKLIIFDDVSFGGAFKKKLNGVIAKIFCNGRHQLISCICTAQKYTDLATTMRENATWISCFGGMSNRQMETIYDDYGEIPKKYFIKMYRETTKEPHSTLNIFFDHGKSRYNDTDFIPINVDDAWE